MAGILNIPGPNKPGMFKIPEHAEPILGKTIIPGPSKPGMFKIPEHA